MQPAVKAAAAAVDRPAAAQQQKHEHEQAHHRQALADCWSLHNHNHSSNHSQSSGTTSQQQQQQASQADHHHLQQPEEPQQHRLYGREPHTAALRAALERCRRSRLGRRRQLVLLTGASGTGKTALAHSLKRYSCNCSSTSDSPVDSNNDKDDTVMFISGKFDQLHRPENYYPIAQALTELVRQILNNYSAHHPYRQRVTAALQDIISTDRLLLDVVPALELLLLKLEDDDDNINHSNAGTADTDATGSSNSSTSTAPAAADHGAGGGTNNLGAQNRLIFSLCQFLRKVCSAATAVVLFVDDLQWSDSDSLAVLQALIMDTGSMEGLLVLGACRDNEVNVRHHLSATLRELEANDVVITNIAVHCLDPTAMNRMISDRLRMPEETTRELAEFVCLQTDGNIFFASQYLRALSAEGLLQYDDKQKRWAFDNADDKVIVNLDFQDAVRLLTVKIRHLGPVVQELLAFAACLGARFDPYILGKLLVVADDNDPCHNGNNSTAAAEVACADPFSSCLMEAVEQGLIHRISATAEYAFFHDQIQQSAYSLIPEEERDAKHLQIGRTLYAALTEEELQTHLPLVVNQLRRGAHLMENQDEKDKMACLCLQAAEQVLKSSSFLAAATFLEVGIGLLGTRHWRDEYELSIELYNAAIEVEYSAGNLRRMDRLLDAVLLHARCFDDKVRAYTAAVYALGSRSETHRAIDLAVEVLEQLGESGFYNTGRLHLAMEFNRTKALIKKHTNREIRNLPRMTDSKRQSILRIMNLILPYCHMANPTLFRLNSMRIIQTTFKHGLSSMSCPGFAAFSIILVDSGEVELGVRLGHLAVDLVDALNAKQWLARVYVGTYGHSLKSELASKEILKPLLKAHRVALGCGDIEFSLFAAAVYVRTAVFVATPLAQLVTEMETFQNLMDAFQQKSTHRFMQPTYQFALNMMGRAQSASVLTGDAMNEEAMLAEAREKHVDSLASAVYTFKLILLYHFGRYKAADAISAKLEKCDLSSFTSFSLSYLYLYQGLTACAGKGIAARFGSNTRLANAKLKSLKKICGKRKQSLFRNKVSLLEAEIAAVSGRIDEALSKYEDAVTWAQQEKILSEVGLAHERASIMLRRAGREKEAARHVQGAVEAYQKWGAHAKLQYLRFLFVQSEDFSTPTHGVGTERPLQSSYF